MEKPRKVLRGELALVFAVIINSFGVVLMLQSQSGISAISSVPYAFSEVLPQLSLGTWTYIFQGLLIASLFILRRKIVPEYLLSFAVGFCFGIFVDLHESWVQLLPQSLPLDVLYFAVSYLLIAFGIALSNRCRMPITPHRPFPAGTGGDCKSTVQPDQNCLRCHLPSGYRVPHLYLPRQDHGARGRYGDCGADDGKGHWHHRRSA